MAGDKKTEAESTEAVPKVVVPKAVSNIEKIDEAIETMLASFRTNMKTAEFNEMAEAVLKMSNAKAQLVALDGSGKGKTK